MRVHSSLLSSSDSPRPTQESWSSFSPVVKVSPLSIWQFLLGFILLFYIHPSELPSLSIEVLTISSSFPLSSPSLSTLPSLLPLLLSFLLLRLHLLFPCLLVDHSVLVCISQCLLFNQLFVLYCPFKCGGPLCFNVLLSSFYAFSLGGICYCLFLWLLILT